MLTLREVMERLERYDEVSICELLDLHSDELVRRFSDKVEARFDQLAEDLEDEEE